jgi:hypothetical protein
MSIFAPFAYQNAVVSAAPAPPPLYTTDLQLWYDAGNTSSYPGTGTTWTDLQGNYNITSIDGSIAFSGSAGGSTSFFQFPGNRHMLINNSIINMGASDNEAWEFILYKTSTLRNGNETMVQHRNGTGTPFNICTLNSASSNQRINYETGGPPFDDGIGTSNAVQTNNKFYHIVYNLRKGTGTTGYDIFLNGATDFTENSTQIRINLNIAGIGNNTSNSFTEGLRQGLSIVRYYRGTSFNGATLASENYAAYQSRFSL